jgi:hypothetical protein
MLQEYFWNCCAEFSRKFKNSGIILVLSSGICVACLVTNCVSYKLMSKTQATLIRACKYMHMVSVLLDIKFFLSKQEKNYLRLVFIRIATINFAYVLGVTWRGMLLFFRSSMSWHYVVLQANNHMVSQLKIQKSEGNNIVYSPDLFTALIYSTCPPLWAWTDMPIAVSVT